MDIRKQLDSVIDESLDCFDHPPARQGRPPLPPGADFASPATMFLAKFSGCVHTPELVNPLTHVGLMFAARNGRNQFLEAMHKMADEAVRLHPLAS